MGNGTNPHIGNGSFFYPPIVVYEQEAEKKLRKPTGFCIRKIVVNYVCDSDLRVLVTDDGCVCPIFKNYTKPFDFLNVLFATFTTKGYVAHHMIPSDFSAFSWNDGDDYVKVNNASILQSMRSQFERKRDGDNATFMEWELMDRIPVHKSVMESLLGVAYRFYKNQESKEDVLLFGETFGLYFDEMYKASFLYSWMLIENFLERSWIEYVDSLSLKATENKILKEFVRQTSDNYIKMFTKLEMIDTKGCQALKKLRELRNQIIHYKQPINRDEAYEAMKISLEILYNRFNRVNPFKDIKLEKLTP